MTKEIGPVGYYPLWGASFDSDEIGMVNDLVCASYPYQDEWFDLMTRSARLHALMTDDLTVFVKDDLIPGRRAHIPLCLTTFTLQDDARWGLQDVQYLVALKKRFDARIRMAVTALRLYKPGWFLDPSAGQISVRDGEFILKWPGLYRDMLPRLVYGWSPEDGYRLSIQDLLPVDSEGMEQPPRLYRIAEALGSLKRDHGFPEGRPALATWNFSYEYGLSDRQRYSLLFTALETALGPMSSWSADDSVGRMPFQRRVERAIRLSGRPDAKECADWMDNPRGGRGIRNAIAHGSQLVDDHTLVLARLREVVRSSLLALVGFAAASQDNEGINVRPAGFVQLLISIDRGDVSEKDVRQQIANCLGPS
jgi:hypothetical protein